MEVHLVVERAQRVELEVHLAFQRDKMVAQRGDMTRLLRSTQEGNEPTMEEEEEEDICDDKHMKNRYSCFCFIHCI